MTDTEKKPADAASERQRRIKAEETLVAMKMFLFDYFHRLGPDPQRNIDIIVETACKALNAAVGLYNRLEGDRLRTWSIHNAPSDFKREDAPAGHICYDMTIRKRSADNLAPVVLEDLAGSRWEQLDANVKTYGISSYLAFPVLLENTVVGSLCVVDTDQRAYSQIEKDILEAFSKAVALEEERKRSQERLIQANAKLVEKNQDLEAALSEVKTLSGLLPICSSCKKIRDDKGYWKQIETYVAEHSEAQFSHSMCRECAEKMYGRFLKKTGPETA